MQRCCYIYDEGEDGFLEGDRCMSETSHGVAEGNGKILPVCAHHIDAMTYDYGQKGVDWFKVEIPGLKENFVQV